jgi:hypothetical protein
LNTQTTKWFIEPIGDSANEALAAELAREGLGAESETIIRFQGTQKRVYQAEYRFATMLYNSEKHSKKIRVYNQQGNGEIKLWTLGGKKSLKQSKEYKRVQQLLK